MKITNVVLIPKVDTSQTVMLFIKPSQKSFETDWRKFCLARWITLNSLSCLEGQSKIMLLWLSEALHAMKNKRCETHRDLTLYAIVRHMTELSGNISRGCFKGCCFMRNGLDGCDFVFDRLNTPLRWMTILWDPLHRAEGYGKDIHCHRTFSSCAWKGCRSL